MKEMIKIALGVDSLHLWLNASKYTLDFLIFIEKFRPSRRRRPSLDNAPIAMTGTIALSRDDARLTANRISCME
jgi:hypothetical protein